MINKLLTDETAELDVARRAFDQLEPIRADYPLVPIQDGFNWEACASGISVPELYLVVFRSVRRKDADLTMLKTFDDRAFEDAQQAPGFLFYFKGQITPERECLSFCLWSSRAEARSASDRPAHADAASLVTRMYESYDLERHRLHQKDDSLVFERLPG